MSDNTTHLVLPYILAAQAQKHVTHNEALRLLDALVQLSVLDRDLTAPPASPADGDRYIVASGGTGAWGGWDLSIAYWVDGAWTRLAPREGWLSWVADEDLLLVFDGAGWIVGGGGVTLAELGDGTVAILGVGTAGDSTNRLAVRSNSVLFTAINAGDGGTGDMRYVVNKESAGDTASFLFQTAWSGRAEIGLMGSDLFGVKVSPDGSDWRTALIVDQDGRLLSGVAEDVTVNNTRPFLQVHGTSASEAALFGARWGNNDARGTFTVAKSRSESVGVLGTPVQNGDGIAGFIASADNGSAFALAADIQMVAAGDWAASSGRSARFEFRTRHANSLGVRLLVESDGAFKPLSIATTASGANAFLDGANQNNLLRSTSSERYKQGVEPVEETRSDAILSLQPIWYRSTAPADRADWSWYGLIAEDVAAIEPRLVQYGYHDEDYELVPEEAEEGTEPSYQRVLKKGAVLKPDGVQHDRLAVLLLDVVKRQEARIAALEARLAESAEPAPK